MRSKARALGLLGAKVGPRLKTIWLVETVASTTLAGTLLGVFSVPFLFRTPLRLKNVVLGKGPFWQQFWDQFLITIESLWDQNCFQNRYKTVRFSRADQK